MTEIDFSPALERVQSMIEGFIGLIPNLIVAVVIFMIFLVLAAVIRSLVKRFAKRANMPDGAELVLGRLSRTVVLLIGLLVSLTIVFDDFTAAQVIEVLGIGGVAVGFAFRDILQNFLAGILILVTQSFRIGDQIIIGEYEGTVEDIYTRATHIKTYDGRLVVIPNADLFTQSVLVNTAYETRRSEFEVGIGYGDDIGLAKRLILEAVRSVDEVLASPEPEVLVVKLAESSVNIQARWWTPSRSGDVVSVQDRVIWTIKDSLAENGIDMPFPTRQVLFHDQTEETDGDRLRQREGWPLKPGEQPPRPSRMVMG